MEQNIHLAIPLTGDIESEAVGAVPVFADIGLDAYNLDPRKAAKKTPKTRPFCRWTRWGFPGIGIPGPNCGKRAWHRPMCMFQLSPAKNINTGESGMVVSDDVDLISRTHQWANHETMTQGPRELWSRKNEAPKHPGVGFKYCMSEVPAAIGLAQMERLPGILARRRRLAELYDRAFSKHDPIVVPGCSPDRIANAQTYQIRIDGADWKSRQGMVNTLRSRGVMANFGVVDIHRQAAYRRHFGPQKYPKAEFAADTGVALPLYPQMTDRNLERCAGELIKTIPLSKKRILENNEGAHRVCFES